MLSRRPFLASLVGFLGVVGGCSSRSSAHTPASPTAAVAPTPAQSIEVPISSCRRASVVHVADERRRPEVVVGADRVAVVHRARRRADFLDAECAPWKVLSHASFPLRDGGFDSTAATTPVCESAEVMNDDGGTIALGAAVADGVVYRLACVYDSGARSGENDVDPSFGCEATPIGTDGVGEGFGFDIRPPGYGLVSLDRVRGRLEMTTVGSHQVFLAAITGMSGESSGVYAAVRTGGRTIPSGRIGFGPEGDVEDRGNYGFEFRETARGGFEITHGPLGGPRRTRVPFDADGMSGDREGIDAVASSSALDFVVERADGVPPTIWIVKDGVRSPLEGPSATDGAFAPSFALVGRRVILVWSEGLDRATRIRGAIVDPSRGAIVGPIVDLSTPGAEAGYASVAAHGDRVVVSWDEKANGRWRVLVAELECG